MDLGDRYESVVASHFFEKMQFVNINGVIRNILSQQEMNGVVKLNNEYLLTSMPKSSDKYIRSCADMTITLNDYLAKRNIDFVYAAPPYTTSKFDSQLPDGIIDYGNDNIDRYLELLDVSHVDTIDFRKTMFADGINQYDMMYRTDHHWTTEAGLYAFGILEDYIKNKTKCSIDSRISNIINYDIHI